MLVALNFHYVRPTYPEPFEGIHGVTPADLGRQLELLARAGRFVSPNEVVRAVQAGDGFTDLVFLVTFDDGLREQYGHAVPVLDRLGIGALFFVNTAPILERRISTVHKVHLVRAHSESSWCLEQIRARVGGSLSFGEVPQRRIREAYPYDAEDQAELKYFLNYVLSGEAREEIVGGIFRARFGEAEKQMADDLYMDQAQLRTLADRGWLGSHGHEHVALGLLPGAAQEHQVSRAQDHLEAWTGHRPFAFSFPYGSREASRLRTPSGLSDAGVTFAFTMERAGNRALTHPFQLARFDCNDLPGGRSPLFPFEDLAEGIPDRSWPFGEARS